MISSKFDLKTFNYHQPQPHNPENISDEITSDTDPEESDLTAKISPEEIEDEYSEPESDDEEKILIVDETEDGSIVIN